MDEIREVLLPALQLASMFISDPAALEWFAHVRYARWVDLEDGEAKLVRDSKTFTRAQTKTVQAELLRLAPRLRIFWFDRMYDIVPSKRSKIYGRAIKDLLELFCSYKSKPYGQALTKKFDRGGFLPSIHLNTKYFEILMGVRYAAFPEALPANAARLAQFELAKTLVHELAHIWVAKCHIDARYSKEPFFNPSGAMDVVAEAGWPWEHFMFDAHASWFIGDTPALEFERRPSVLGMFGCGRCISPRNVFGREKQL
jgi:hypothetical protein